MSLLPCPQQHIESCREDMPDYSFLPADCFGCGERATEEHHVVRRSAITGYKDWVYLYGSLVQNKMPLCLPCHDRVELKGNRETWAWIEYTEDDGFVWHDKVPSKVGLTEGDDNDSVENGGEGSAMPSSLPSPSVSPGEKCDTCGRRIPHPRKKDSPKSQVVGIRVPEDERESLEVAWTDFAERADMYGDKFWRKETLVLLLAFGNAVDTETLKAAVAEYRGRDGGHRDGD